jgi:beta-glucosidase
MPNENSVNKDKKMLRFPEGFLWGTSTSAYQIEGGNHNDWSEWESSPRRRSWLARKKKNPADYTSGQACDSYNRYVEDFDLVKKLNNNAVRLGIEWSRIQPKRDTWDVDEINHYRDVLKTAHEHGLKTIVTLWHWTNPTWLQHEKGWLNKRVVQYFGDYTDMIVRELGGYIDYWVTVNEPTSHAFNGYMRRFSRRGYHSTERWPGVRIHWLRSLRRIPPQ